MRRGVTRAAGDSGGEQLTMSDQLTHDLSLMLMYLSSWTERPDEARRFWKGFEFDILNQLAEEGLISDSRRAKSAYLTEDGLRRARELLATCCVHSAEGEQGAGVDETEEPEPAIVRLYAGAD